MEVTRKNFDEILPEVLDSIDKCCFMAIDCEYSGLAVTDEKDNCFETVEERYHVIRKSATQFLVIQFGLCPFFYDSKKDEFTHKAFNFYTYPRQDAYNAPNVRFLCESSSLDFLASCGFDFNKLIYDGIPYLTISAEEKMRQEYEKRAAYLASEENTAPIVVPENLRSFMVDTEERIKRLHASSVSEIIMENLTNYQRKLIFHNIKPKYADTLYFETVVVSDDETDEVETDELPSKGDDNKSESKEQSALDDSKTRSNNKKSSPPTNGSAAAAAVKKNPNHGNRNRALRVTKLSQEEQDSRNSKKKKQEMDNISKNVGFSKVIRKISQSNKIVVGHNMLLDVSHSVHQFIDDLPNSLAEFKLLVQSTFPNLIDTKLMSSSHPFRELVSSTVLFDLVKRLQTDPFKMPAVRKVQEKNSEGYDFSDRKRHEAGYDAYITGRCFLAMCQYLGTLQEPKKARVLPQSPLVMPFLNKLYMMRMLDITYLNISGTDLTPSRSHVFHVTCPENGNAKSIQNLFNPFGTVQIWWRSPTSLFVSLVDKDQSGFVNANIENKPGYKVIPFELYQKQQAEKKRPLLSPSPERDEKKNEKLMSIPKTAIGGDHKKKRPKTDSENRKATEHFQETPFL